jgi:hypothetical protein
VCHITLLNNYRIKILYLSFFLIKVTFSISLSFSCLSLTLTTLYLLNVTLSCNQNDGTRNSSNNVVDLGERADVIRSRRQHNLWCLKTRCKAGNVCWCCIFEKQFSDQEVECYLDKKTCHKNCWCVCGSRSPRVQ